MKTNIRQNARTTLPRVWALLIAVALTGLCGCTSDIDKSFQDDANGTLELVLGDNQSPLSKAHILGGSGLFVWETGDEVAIYFGGSENKYKPFAVQEGGTVDVKSETQPREKYAIFPPASAPSSDAFDQNGYPRVIYPETIDIKNDDEKIKTESQTPILAVNSSDPSVLTDTNTLTFYHVGGLLRIKLEGMTRDYKSVKVAFEQSTITGTFTVDVSDTKQPKANSLVAGTGGNAVIFNLPGNDGVLGTIYLNIPLPLVSYGQEKLTLSIYEAKDAAGTASKVLERDINLGTVNRADGRLCSFSMQGLVSGIEGVSISTYPDNRELYLDDVPFDFPLAATVYYSTGGATSTATDPGIVKWSSSNPDVVLVEVNSGKIAAVSEGTARITATSVDDDSKSDYVDITVKANSGTGDFDQRDFSVSATSTVKFSPGNLQATIVDEANPGAANGAEWKFATKQYDYIGAHEGSSISLSAGSTIDLFYYSGADNDKYRYGIALSENTEDYFSTTHNEFIDWGNNTISYRGKAYANPYEYRTLSTREWKYLLEERTGAKAGRVGNTTNCRFSMVTVENIFGMIIYPDNFAWIRSTMGPMPTRFNVYSPSCGSYSGANWAALERAGVVFLPAGGYRVEKTVYTSGQYGYYMATPSKQKWPGDAIDVNVGNVSFSAGHIGTGSASYSTSVRLVKGGKSVRKIDGLPTTIQMSAGSSKTLSATIHYQDGSTKAASYEILGFDEASWDWDASFSLSGNTLTASSYGYTRLIATDGDGNYSSLCLVGASDGYVHLPDDGKKVIFSPGNLRAKLDNSGNPIQWRFADKQWDYQGNKTNIDGGNANLSIKDGWIDRFSYSTSHDGGKYGIRWVWLNYSERYTFMDYSDCNIINDSNGTGYWRTLSEEEWLGILRSYPVIKGGQLVDDLLAETVYCVDTYCLSIVPTGFIKDDNFSTTINESVASDYTNAGIVFLPVGFVNGGLGVPAYQNGYGAYWTSSVVEDDTEYYGWDSSTESEYTYWDTAWVPSLLYFNRDNRVGLYVLSVSNIGYQGGQTYSSGNENESMNRYSVRLVHIE